MLCLYLSFFALSLSASNVKMINEPDKTTFKTAFDFICHVYNPKTGVTCTSRNPDCNTTITTCDNLCLYITVDTDDVLLEDEEYNEYLLPSRDTKPTACYTFLPKKAGIYKFFPKDYPHTTPLFVINVVEGTCAKCPTLSASSTNVCSGQSVLLTAQGDAPSYTVQPGNIVLTTGIPKQITPPAGTTKYSLAATGICPETSVNVTVTNATSLTVSASTTTLCNPGPVVITAKGLTPGTNYTLYPDNITSNSGVFTVYPKTTTTYSIIGNNSSCCTIAGEITIKIGKDVIPTFNQVSPICLGSTLSPLATTSLNGIKGTWYPALNNTATTTYTFTPLAGQCALPTTMTIVVNKPITPIFAPINSICFGGNLTALPTTSSNGIIGSWSPALNNTATTKYTFTPNAGQCATSATMTIVVNPLIIPTFTQIAPICSGGTLAPLPTTSLNGIKGTWTPAINNTTTTTYVFTPVSNQCAKTTSMTIKVGAPTVTVTASKMSICEGETVTLTPSGADNYILFPGTLSSNGTSFKVTPTQTTTYTIIGSTTDCCKATTQITIEVKKCVVECPTPLFNSVSLCYGDTSVSLPTTSLNGISGKWFPALNNTASGIYTFTPNNPKCPPVSIEVIVFPKNKLSVQNKPFNQTKSVWICGLTYVMPNTVTANVSSYNWYYYPNGIGGSRTLIGTGSSVDTCLVIGATYPGIVVLEARDENGCPYEVTYYQRS